MRRNTTTHILSSLMAGALALSLSACGSKPLLSYDDSSDGTAKTAETATAETTGERTEIEYWYCLVGSLGEAVQTMIADFNDAQDAIYVKGVQLSNYDEAAEVFQASIAARDVPAAVMLNDGAFNSFMEKGALLCLDDMLKNDPDSHFEDFLSSLQEFSKSTDGKTYGMPAFCSTHIAFYSRAIFEKAQLDPSRC